ncbi:diacylglycerol/lipid kinase family protein [Nodosilinea sp. PGN35]|uniref:diacylglycerol/lipid kinase family protein n=1 Tax=Nodosilinea sp. PGN35 TaxID=3020489 RepID=UPI0023B27484|nr:diacylglycerol kinase family protein [Nodosilinea sp. TSF1-S3]MDF0368218.1 diacylglycerol kinase family protein [Nodosilinea sp. TSF1-S3]
MRVTLIHNSKAGDGEQPSGDVLTALIRQAGYDVVYRSAKDEDWQATLNDPGAFVVAAGGDGTVGKVAKQLVGRGIPLAILPLGTANNIAKTFGLLETPLEQLIGGWADAQRVSMDGAIAHGPWGSTYCIESVGLGLFVQTLAQANHSSALDRAESADDELAAALKMLNQQIELCAAQPLTVVLDGQDISGQYVLLEAMTIPYVGPNLHFAPEAGLGDGQLTVVLVREGEQAMLSEYLNDCLAGKQDPAPLTSYRGQHLRIEGQGFDIHADDDILPYHTWAVPPNRGVIEVKVDPQALELLLPSRGDSQTYCDSD